MIIFILLCSIYFALFALVINDEDDGFDCGIKFDKGQIKEKNNVGSS
jgi:hypothetical protein